MPETFAFEWRKPRLHAYRAADSRRLAFHLNRYPGVVIGAGFQIGRRVITLRWGAPGRSVGMRDSR